MKSYDTIIIGSGPAAVTAASILASKNIPTLIIEKGRDIARRRSLINGWFGRGFYMGQIELEDKKLNNIKATKKAVNLVSQILNWTPDNKYYSVVPLDAGYNLATHFFNILIPKVDVLFDAEVQEVSKIKRKFQIITPRGTFFSRRCVVATGCASYYWMKKLCSAFNITPSKKKAKIGIRVEIAASAVENMKETKIKNITCDNIHRNAFITEWEDSEIISAAGYEIPRMKTDRTNFMLSTEPPEGTEEVIRITKIANILSDDRVRRESIKDFIDDRSVLQHLNIFDDFKQVFEKMHEDVPALIDHGSIYIPEVKLNGILPVSDNMRTKVAKLYGIGECTNKVSTIIGAMASGLIGARTILEEM